MSSQVCSLAAKLPLRSRAVLLSLVVTAATMAVLAVPARAQDNTQPLEFEVRPSGVEEESPQDRLERRLKQREFLFRSICIQCGRGDRFQSNAPFNPIEALRKPE